MSMESTLYARRLSYLDFMPEGVAKGIAYGIEAVGNNEDNCPQALTQKSQTSSTNNPKMSSRKYNRKCFVPGCRSNNYDQPLKAFIKLPTGTDVRKQWAQAVGRSGKNVYFNPVSSVYCCGDHFNLEQDAENWMKYRIMGGGIKLKPGVLPRISKNENKDPLSLEKMCKVEQTVERLQPEEVSCDLKDIQCNVGTDSIGGDTIDIKYEPILNSVKTEPEEICFVEVSEAQQSTQGYESMKPKPESVSHKDIQCNISTRKRVRSKSTQTDSKLLTCSRATSPIKFRKQRKK